MTDTDIAALVERLRFSATELDGHYSQATIFVEAADALEALLVEVDGLKVEIGNQLDDYREDTDIMVELQARAEKAEARAFSAEAAFRALQDTIEGSMS